jgi:pantothenate synthetase
LIGTEPKVRLEYLSAVDPETLEEVRQIKQRFLLALAAHVGQTRLIDNIMI